MHRLGWLILTLAMLWCVWWAVASAVLQQSIETWFEDRRAIGWKAEAAEVTKRGFPTRLHTRLQEVSLADPVTGISAELFLLDLMAVPYWPGFVTVGLPHAPTLIRFPSGSIVSRTNNAKVRLRIRPNSTLQLQSLALTSDTWSLSQANDAELFASGKNPEQFASGKTVRVAMIQSAISPALYRFELNVAQFTPGPLARVALKLPTDWPTSFDKIAADVDIAFDRPLDRFAFTNGPPQPRKIIFREFEFAWGDVQISAAGDISIDTAGIPTGSINLDAANWRQILDFAEASGGLLSAQRPQTEIMLGALSNMNGSPEDLNLMLSFKDGQMALGPITLGPAPRLVLR